jgi:hypothetical protein
LQNRDVNSSEQRMSDVVALQSQLKGAGYIAEPALTAALGCAAAVARSRPAVAA